MTIATQDPQAVGGEKPVSDEEGAYNPQEFFLNRLKPLVTSARAYFSRSNAGNMGNIRKDDAGTLVLFVRNGAIAQEKDIETEIVKFWTDYDAGFKEFYDLNCDLKAEGAFEKLKDVPRPEAKANTPEVTILLASACLAVAKTSNKWLANILFQRMSQFRAPPPKGRVLVDMVRAELDVYNATRHVDYNPDTRFVLSAEEQHMRERTARVKAARLCEQNAVAARRLGDLDLVEEATQQLFNMCIPLLQEGPAGRISCHKSLQKAADLLEEIDSGFVQLRVMLHYESARCEMSLDLLQNSRKELNKAAALDCTVNLENAKLALENAPSTAEGTAEATDEEVKNWPVIKAVTEEGKQDPRFVSRRFMEQQLRPVETLLEWKLALYDEPGDLDAVMLWLDQSPLRESTIERSYAALQRSFEKRFVELVNTKKKEQLIEEAFEAAKLAKNGGSLEAGEGEEAKEVVELTDEEKAEIVERITKDKTLRENYVKLPQWLGKGTEGTGILPDNPNAAPCVVYANSSRTIGSGTFLSYGEDIFTDKLDSDENPNKNEAAVASGGTYDNRMQADKELALTELRRILLLLSETTMKAAKHAEVSAERVLVMADLTLSLERFLSVGPHPVDAEIGIALAEVCYAKAAALFTINGSTICGVPEASLVGSGMYSAELYEGIEFFEDLEMEFSTSEEKDKDDNKKDIVKYILYGLRLAEKFQQPYLVLNGLRHFWSFHMDVLWLVKEVKSGFFLPLEKVLRKFKPQRSSSVATTDGEAAETNSVQPVDRTQYLNDRYPNQVVFFNEYFSALRICLTLGEKYFALTQSSAGDEAGWDAATLAANHTLMMSLVVLYLESYSMFGNKLPEITEKEEEAAEGGEGGADEAGEGGAGAGTEGSKELEDDEDKPKPKEPTEFEILFEKEVPAIHVTPALESLPGLNTDETIIAITGKLFQAEKKEVTAQLVSRILEVNQAAGSKDTDAKLALKEHTLAWEPLSYADQLRGAPKAVLVDPYDKFRKIEPEVLEGKKLSYEKCGVEAEVMKLAEQLPFIVAAERAGLPEAAKGEFTAAQSKDLNEKKLLPLFKQSMALLNAWTARQTNETEATLHLELWTRLGRYCLECLQPDPEMTAPKFALMCGLRALNNIDVGQSIAAAQVGIFSTDGDAGGASYAGSVAGAPGNRR